MANKKVSQLTSKPSVLVTDLFPIADPSTGQLYKTTISDLGTAIGSGVSSVNGLVGAVVLDTDDIQELVSPTNKWFTDTRARAAISASSPLAYNSGTGVFSIPAATSSQNGYLTSTDWSTFNSKQAALSGTGFVKISGTTISYDNSTYLTTSAAASTYLPLAGGTLTGSLTGTTLTLNSTIDQVLTLNSSSQYSQIYFQNSGTLKAKVYYGNASNELVIGTYNTGGSVRIETDNNQTALSISSSKVATFSGAINGTSSTFSSSINAATLSINTTIYNGSFAVIKGNNSIPATSGTTTTATLRLTSGTGLYNVLDFGTNESSDYAWIQSTRANGLGTYDKLLLNPNGGNVGIGTILPNASLEINSADLNTLLITNSLTSGATTGSGIGFKAYNGTSVTQSGGIFLTANSWSFGTYLPNQLSIGTDGSGGLALRSSNSAPINFYTGGATAGVSTERMRITSGGQLLINTTTSTTGGVFHALIVKGTATSSQGIWVEEKTNDGAVYIDHNGSVGKIGTSYRASAGFTPIVLETSGSERIRIKVNGIINFSNVPTSSAGLSSGDIYKSAGVLMIV